MLVIGVFGALFFGSQINVKSLLWAVLMLKDVSFCFCSKSDPEPVIAHLTKYNSISRVCACVCACRSGCV